MSKGPHLKNKIEEPDGIGSRQEMLALLTEMARKGSVTAAATLVRELRFDASEEGDNFDDELAKLAGRNGH